MKVLAVDDHWVARAGLRRLLSQLDQQLEVLEAEDFQAALRLAELHPDLDLVLLDLLMPGLSPFDGLGALRDRLPHVPIVVLSMLDNRRDVLRAIELGAMGYIPKSATSEEIIKALRQVLAGEVYVPRLLIDKPGTGVPPTAPGDIQEEAGLIDRLTPRQREVFTLLGHGKTNADIAAELGMSEHTVRLHVSAVLRTLNVSNRTKAGLLAARYASHLETAGAERQGRSGAGRR